MGRLFWKFFFFVWLAQLTTILGASVVFWLERQQDRARWEAGGDGPPPPPHRHFLDGRPPPEWRESPPPDGRNPPPPHRGPHHRPPLPIVPLLAGVIASLVFAALLARYFSKPIRHLRTAFNAVAEGQLDVRLGNAMGRRRDELADLGRDFDRMASRLSDVVDGQRRLLHDVSHEMRSPIARLQAAIGLARQQPARLEDSLQRIEREGMRMDRLVGELLTLSRLEAGVRPSMEEEIPIDELLADIVHDAGFEAESQGRRMVCQLPDGISVRGNGELLQRAIENVVRNAIRHTPVDSEVVIEASSEPAGEPGKGWLRLAVLDSGPGVREEDLAAIFEPFFRSRDNRQGGYGLGLAIARRVIEAHGGQIRAENRPEGGFRLEMILPTI